MVAKNYKNNKLIIIQLDNRIIKKLKREVKTHIYQRSYHY